MSGPYFARCRSWLALLLYQCMIRPRLDYASFVYHSASESSKMFLEPVHHAALRVATGVFRHTPKTSLMAEAHEMTLSLRREMLGMRFTLKLRQFPAHPAYPYVLSPDILALMEALKGPPHSIQEWDLLGQCGTPLRGV